MRAPLDLVLLTAQYPFGNKAETYLEAEIEVLAARFRRVFVLPSHRSTGRRPMPDNATLVEMPWLTAPTRREKWLALLSPGAVRVISATARNRRNWRPYLGWLPAYLDILATNLLKAPQLARFARDHSLDRAIFYDYWFENTTIAVALLRRAGTIGTAVARAHGFDVYDERWDGRPVPFREFKATGLDALLSVSDAGARYLKERCRELRQIVGVSRLGVCVQNAPFAIPTDQPPLIVTCASLVPIKRLDLVPEVLAALERPLRWVHFGDGPERNRVHEAAARLPPRVQWRLAGHVDNKAVLEFYRGNHVDVLLSLSCSEGLPVSMMEALSFGIPIVAVAVNGVPEIVTPRTGIQLSEGAGIREMSDGLNDALDRSRFDRMEIRRLFAENFDARTNYNRFADVLIDLHQTSSASGHRGP